MAGCAQRDLDDYWQALWDDPALALHGALYLWAAGRFARGCVLDLGCEYGFGAALLLRASPALQVLGVDADREALAFAAHAHSVPRAVYLQAVAAALPLQAGSLSGVFLVNLLHLVPEPERILRECWRALKPGAPAIIALPRAWSDAAQREHLLGLAGRVFGHITYPHSLVAGPPCPPGRRFDLESAALVVAECRRPVSQARSLYQLDHG